MRDTFDNAAIIEIDRAAAAKAADTVKGDGNGVAAPATIKAALPAASPGMRLVDPFDRYLEHEPGATGFFDGDFINFNGQTGEWTIGRGNDKRTIGASVPFLVNIRGMAVGWVKIIDGKIVARELGLVVDGYERKLRKELDDAEECRWPFINGIRQDPWKPTTYLPMRNDEDGGLVVYGPFSDSGRGAIKYFVSVVRRSDRGGKDPQVLLESRKFTNQHGGVNYAPVFKIVGWDYWDGQPALEVQPIAVPIAPAAPAKTALAKPERSDMDDEVPF